RPSKRLPDVRFRHAVAWKCGSGINGTDELGLVRYLMESEKRTKAQVYACLRQMEKDGDLLLWQMLPGSVEDATRAEWSNEDGIATDDSEGRGRHDSDTAGWVQRQV